MKLWSVLLGGFLAAAPLCALDPTATLPQLLHRQWDVDDGLPHASVRSLAQSPDGFLWVGTQSGLARFDGIAFEVFDHKSSPLFANDQIESLAVDRAGVLWVGTYGGGLLRLEGGNLRRFGREDGLTVQEILELAIDPGGNLWVGTHGGGVLRFADGRTAAITASMWSRTLLKMSLRIEGERGEIRVFNPIAPHLYNRLTVRTPSGKTSERVAGESTYACQLRAFVAHVRNGTPVPTGPDDAIANMRVIDAVYRAAGLLPRGT